MGNKFLVTNASVGMDGAANQRLLKKHDTFEHETVVRGREGLRVKGGRD